MKRHSYSLLTIYFILITISLFSITNQKQSDLDLVDDDDDEDKKTVEQTVKEDTADDEFDDPDLLHAKKTKDIIKNETKDIFNNIPKESMDDKNLEETPLSLLLIKNYDFIMLSLLLIVIINAIIGKIKNKSMADKFLAKNRQFFEEQYAHLGTEKEYNPKSTNIILRDSYNQFKLFSSGRVYVKWLLCDLIFKKRQDLISMLTSMFLFNERDKILIQSSVVPADDLPFVMGICKKNNVKNMKKSYDELEKFTDVIENEHLNYNLVLLTENNELTTSFFKDKNFLNLYKKVEKYIEYIFFTDRRGIDNVNNYAIALCYDITYFKDDYNVTHDIVVFSHYLIDLICSASLKASYKKAAEQRRREYDAQKSRELAEKNAEELKNKKEELRNEKYNKKNLTVEQAQKLEEKEKKDAIKSMNRKRFKMVKN